MKSNVVYFNVLEMTEYFLFGIKVIFTSKQLTNAPYFSLKNCDVSMAAWYLTACSASE